MSTYEISKSSLLSLKAEILRKQDELVKAKAHNDIKIKTIKKNTPLEIKNKGVESRSKNDEVEDENLLKLSRVTLEAKSKLYDKLSKNVITNESEREYNKRYLVRFDKKHDQSTSDIVPSHEELQENIDKYSESEEDPSEFFDDYDEPGDPSEQWVQYTDCLGRTRSCLRKDLEYIKSKDSDLKRVVELREKEKLNQGPEQVESIGNEPVPQENAVNNETSELLSGDMRRELLRQQWEKEEEEMRNKNDIHYQNVLFNEARSHGVGYYAFSKDEEERYKQQEALKKLRDETEKEQKRSQDLKAMREKQLAARMKAARNRKRARMGLPPEEDEPEPTVDEKAEEEQQKKALEEQEKKKQEQEEQERKAIEAARKGHIRPWDVGKEGVSTKEHYELTQEEWVDKQRQERPTEFAPPAKYNSIPKRGFQSAKNMPDHNIMEKKTLHFTTKKFNKSRRKRSLNPYKSAGYENTGRKTDRNGIDCNETDDQVDCDDRLLNDYNEKSDTNDLNQNKTDTKVDSYDALLKDYNQFNRPAPSGGNYKEISQNKLMEPVPILDECEGDFDDRLLDDYKKLMDNMQQKVDERLNCDSEDDQSRGLGVEIAPPAMFDYYGPSDSKRPKNNVVKGSGILDSIEAGLRFMRKEAEKKKMGHAEDRW